MSYMGTREWEIETFYWGKRDISDLYGRCQANNSLMGAKSPLLFHETTGILACIGVCPLENMRRGVRVPRRMEARVESVIDALNYDFSKFSLEHFLSWLAKDRGRSIQVIDVAFSSSLFGFWCPAETQDYIFVQSSLHPTHRIHIVLHETAHMLLGHKGVVLIDVLAPEQLRELNEIDSVSSNRIHLRVPDSSPRTEAEEREAEYFVALIQQRLLRFSRLQELYGDESSIDELKPYIRGLDFGS